MKLSECCDAHPWGGEEEYGICGKCYEHCEFYDDQEEEKPRGEFSDKQQAIIDRIISEGTEE